MVDRQKGTRQQLGQAGVHPGQLRAPQVSVQKLECQHSGNFFFILLAKRNNYYLFLISSYRKKSTFLENCSAF